MTQMSKDPAIKLFGRTIPLHEARSNSTAVDLSTASSSGSERVLCKETNSTNKPLEETNQTQISCVSTNQENQEPTTNSKPQDNGSGPETPLKKPDKIIPCPRCNSMDTKFCYYNNYNVNQPRHFCKNCQRYWTAGGTMRNVPVGAGRRKNKHPTNPHFHRHVMMTSSSIDPVPVLSGTGPTSVLKFGTEEEKKSNEEQSSCTNSSSNEGSNTGPSMVTGPGPGPGPGPGSSPGLNMQCYPGPGFMWAPAIPFPFMPAGAYWPGPWWTGFANGAMQPALPSSPSSNSSAGSVSGFSSLGKHPREPASQTEEKRNGNLWAPKTVRILDPDEAAKSSIWTTLGFNRDEKKSMFKSFNKGDEMDECKILDAGPVLHANPAALSRFQSFQERT